jgi:hypothetical protein
VDCVSISCTRRINFLHLSYRTHNHTLPHPCTQASYCIGTCAHQFSAQASLRMAQLCGFVFLSPRDHPTDRARRKCRLGNGWVHMSKVSSCHACRDCTCYACKPHSCSLLASRSEVVLAQVFCGLAALCGACEPYWCLCLVNRPVRRLLALELRLVRVPGFVRARLRWSPT